MNNKLSCITAVFVFIILFSFTYSIIFVLTVDKEKIQENAAKAEILRPSQIPGAGKIFIIPFFSFIISGVLTPIVLKIIKEKTEYLS